MVFKKATKSNIKLRMAISGASGSGKTFSALAIASHLGNKIAVIDTENASASRYADFFNFDVCDLTIFHPAKYIEAIKEAENEGYDVIIIDSLTHAWYAELELAGKGFDGWKNVRPIERKLIEGMIGSKAHIIATMRSKTEYIMEEYTAKDGKVKSSPKKIGTAPIQASNIEYEFDIAGELDYEHILTISKSRCSTLSNRTFLNPGKDLALELKAWLNSASAIVPIQPVVTSTATGEQTHPEHNAIIREIRLMLNTDPKALVEQLKTEFLVKEPQYLYSDQMPELIRWMGVEWAKCQGVHPNHAANSYDKHIPSLMQQGLSVVEAVRQCQGSMLSSRRGNLPEVLVVRWFFALLKASANLGL